MLRYLAPFGTDLRDTRAAEMFVAPEFLCDRIPILYPPHPHAGDFRGEFVFESGMYLSSNDEKMRLP